MNTQPDVRTTPRTSRAPAGFAAILLAAILAACAPPEPPADLVIINGAEPESLDPGIATGQADGRIVRSLFEGLTRNDPVTGGAAPALAERWDISPDGMAYTFHLRTNAVWSTGEPITAEDVVYSWRRVLDPATAAEYAGQLFFVKNGEEYNTGKINDPSLVAVRALDARTLHVELTGPTAFFLDLCAFPTLAVVPRRALEKHGDRWLLTPPVPTSGTYILDHWRVHNKIRLRKNPRHWAADEVHCDIVDFISMDSPITALNLYETGQADIIWDKTLIPSELMDVLRRRPDCHTFGYLGTYFYRYNLTRKPFDDVRVRRALALAVDKRRLVEKITRGGEQTASHFVPRGTANYDPPEGLGYDPDTARRLLAEAGFPGGKGFPRIQYLFNTSKIDQQISVELQAMWTRELGIQMELRNVEWKVYLAAQSALDYDLSRSSWIGDYNDPNTFLDMFMSNNGNNRTGWKSDRYDRLIREGNSQTDLVKRAAILREAELLLIRDELPVIPLYFYAGVNFFDTNRIEGIYFNVLDEHPVHAIRKRR